MGCFFESNCSEPRTLKKMHRILQGRVSPVKDYEGVECDPEIYRNHLHALKRATTFENTEQGPLP